MTYAGDVLERTIINGVFMAHPWSETGVCLERGLGLTDMPRGRPDRKPGVWPLSGLILFKINPSPGISLIPREPPMILGPKFKVPAP